MVASEVSNVKNQNWLKLAALTLPSLLIGACGRERENQTIDRATPEAVAPTEPAQTAKRPQLMFDKEFLDRDRDRLIQSVQRSVYKAYLEKTNSAAMPKFKASGRVISLTEYGGLDSLLKIFKGALHYLQTDQRTKWFGDDREPSKEHWGEINGADVSWIWAKYSIETGDFNLSVSIASEQAYGNRRTAILCWDNHNRAGELPIFNVVIQLSIYHPEVPWQRIPKASFTISNGIGMTEHAYEIVGYDRSTELDWRKLSEAIEHCLADKQYNTDEDFLISERHRVETVQDLKQLLREGLRDFSNYDLSGLDLRDINFSDYYFERPNHGPFLFRAADLRDTKFSGSFGPIPAQFNAAIINDPQNFTCVDFTSTIGLEDVQNNLLER